MILNIYKPKNWTSFDVVGKVRGLLGVKKVGHTGTLDPLAEGVLIVLTEEDTKKQADIMKTDKEYVAEIAFGAYSETLDMEKTPRLAKEIPSVEIIEADLKKVLPSYIGEIEQKIPKFSAKKIRGKPMYKKARKGTIEDKDLPLKTIKIYEFEINSLYEKEIETLKGKIMLPVLKCKITCSSGTYIRAIARDIGRDLGTEGVLLSLTRTRVGGFSVDKSITIEEFEKQLSKKYGL